MSCMSEIDILVNELSKEIAAAIGGTPDIYRRAATKAVSEIPAFNELGNWAINVTVPGFSCTVITDAGTTIVISPVFDEEDPEDRLERRAAALHDPSVATLVCCRHCGDPTGHSFPICDDCDDRMSR